ncbi:hypothetical protein PIB30_047328 [Stylosanthes scabra]|uniref:Uncharacterized protein n=1 Tax=Stylosanthes scabra TaxID=79078 RepID=A0ABU6RGR4_9FABA|nr:hypothetical protein [Stylosanthes scabra]
MPFLPLHRDKVGMHPLGFGSDLEGRSSEFKGREVLEELLIADWVINWIAIEHKAGTVVKDLHIHNIHHQIHWIGLNELFSDLAVTGSILLSPGPNALLPVLTVVNLVLCVRICFLCDEMCRARHSCLDAYASSPYAYTYRTIIYCCEALDVSFLMELEPSHLDLCSSCYAQISDKRSGLTALGDF